ncbi:lysine biosynthesis protein LysW [Streptomyces sp. NPDC101150]|uniref:lysine biosynthesis protein LysW n=1 Tax=Streptomyces sp. NPDC101150 TaxID=3366114 RepID=UPI00380CFC09
MSEMISIDCPECEAPLTLPPPAPGETLACPECLLTLRVERVDAAGPVLTMVEPVLRDWGE